VTAKGASTAGLRTGDKVTVKQLLYALMLPSGCDAAYALADTFGTGSTMKARVSSFISKMNKQAKTLKMTKTHYDSFDGISTNSANYTTPRDLAKLAHSTLTNTTFRTVVKTKKTTQKATNGHKYTWSNTNQLLSTYKGAIGIKTGTGTAAGRCIVFAATRSGRTIIGVILNDKTRRYPDAKAMLDWAFSSTS
jgi:D-alanyl-D-alanine carboxypeptidase (penicillin-binding protein 5/6)